MHCSLFNMREQNLNIMKPPVRKNAPGPVSKATSAMQSLDLLRQNIQRNINQEIQTVLSKYMDVYVKPGIENIRNNLGADAVTEEHLSNLCRQILDEAKKMYPVYNTSLPLLSPSGASNNSTTMEHTEADTNCNTQNSQLGNPATNAPDVKLPLQSPSFAIKRESDTDSEASSMSNASKKAKKSEKKSNNPASGNGSTTGNNSTSPVKPKKPSGPFKKHVAQWDSNKLTADTMFIMGAKANKALGFAQTRGRLYVKHPGLFKYASDADDKEWLSKNKLMPATGGRAYIMLLEDIEKLAKDNTLNLSITYDDIKGFKVPEFILEKMKSYINSWKKTYAEEDEKNAALLKSRNANGNTKSANHQQSSLPAPRPGPTTIHNMSTPTNPAANSNHITCNPIVTSMGALPAPTPQSLPPHTQSPLQLPNHVGPPQNIGNYLGPNSTSVLYDPSFGNPQPHELPEFLHIDKPPPMYPGQPPQQSQQQPPPAQQPPQQGQQHQIQIPNTSSTNFVHSNQMDSIEQAISKGDWSSVSERSLLQYALQSTRNIASWDPQDSFDLIESVTNGGLGGGVIGENSPLLQISPNAGAHLAAPPLGPVSPNCELSAVLDQVSAFQYTET